VEEKITQQHLQSKKKHKPKKEVKIIKNFLEAK
jgi:hypothetical protein